MRFKALRDKFNQTSAPRKFSTTLAAVALRLNDTVVLCTSNVWAKFQVAHLWSCFHVYYQLCRIHGFLGLQLNGYSNLRLVTSQVGSVWYKCAIPARCGVVHKQQKIAEELRTLFQLMRCMQKRGRHEPQSYFYWLGDNVKNDWS